ncbi:MAG: hypothetical protein Q4B06_02665 [Candidatus Saccharibacteria bacterium]|nr:hypothetical protein [Candidatus Saccharibacteria bacterium]
MPAATKKRLQRIVLWSVAVCGVLLVTLIGLAMWTGSTEPIESVAKTFKPGEGWKQTRYIVEPPRLVCLSGRCPDFTQSWMTDKITESKIKGFLGDLKNTSLSEFRCTYSDGTSVDSCVTSGVRDGYRFQVYADKSRDGRDVFEIDLFIREER